MHFTSTALTLLISTVLATPVVSNFSGAYNNIPGINNPGNNNPGNNNPGNNNPGNNNPGNNNPSNNNGNEQNNNYGNDNGANIFPDFDRYSDWAICTGIITKTRFPNLQAPNNNGGCVRYYRGIDMTGVVTERHFFFRDGFKNACDCAAQCLNTPTSCTNWVWKHTFMTGDDGKRSCTTYSSPNLPTNVTLAYNLANSTGFALLQPGNNPQMGAPAPLTFLDQAGKIPDKFGVSGFMVQDQNNRQYC